jgi:hypothetical protein
MSLFRSARRQSGLRWNSPRFRALSYARFAGGRYVDLSAHIASPPPAVDAALHMLPVEGKLPAAEIRYDVLLSSQRATEREIEPILCQVVDSSPDHPRCKVIGYSHATRRALERQP